MTQKPLLSDLLKEHPKLLVAAEKAHSTIIRAGNGRLTEKQQAEMRALGQVIASARRSTGKGGETKD